MDQSRPPAGDGFELVEKDYYKEAHPTWCWCCTDHDEYGFIEAPMMERHAQRPVGGDSQAFPPPGRETTILGCDQAGYHTETTIVQSTPPQPQKAVAKEEEFLFFYDVVVAATDEPPSPRVLYDLVNMRSDVSDLDDDPAVPSPAQHGHATAAAPPPPPPLRRPSAVAAHSAADGEDDQDEDDYDLYKSYYDLAEFGRSRRVKPSSGRRGRTKQATTKGRPRGEERSSYIAGNL